MRRITLLVLAALLSAAPALHAQKDQKEPRRPKLIAGADTNDADAYFDFGQRSDVSWKDTYAADWWAYRLEPDNPQYLYALYIAMWNKQPPEWRSEYLNDAEYVVKSKEAHAIDSLYNEVLIHDPFAHIYYDRCLVPDWIETEDDDLWAAYVLEDRNCYRQASERYAKSLAAKPKQLGTRFNFSRALYFSGNYGGTIAQLDTVLEQMRTRDQKRLSHVYQTKTMFEYMRGWAFVRQQNWDAARDAFGRALSEDVSFYMAHSALAKVALLQGDAPTAVQELDLAVQLRGDEPVLRNEYGVALLQNQRPAEAEAQFRKALELDPWFVTAYYNLAEALDVQKRYPEALQTYQQFMTRVPKRAVVLGVKAGKRVKEMQAAGITASAASPGAPSKP